MRSDFKVQNNSEGDLPVLLAGANTHHVAINAMYHFTISICCNAADAPGFQTIARFLQVATKVHEMGIFTSKGVHKSVYILT